MDHRSTGLFATRQRDARTSTVSDIPAEAGEFLRDLRRMRERAGLRGSELAARAHYPLDVVTTAETGPDLPELPLLAAYVRGCGGSDLDIGEWEDRWRHVTGATASPLRQARSVRNPDAIAAAARARADAATSATGHDPTAIMDALNKFAATRTVPGDAVPQKYGVPGMRTPPPAEQDTAAAPRPGPEMPSASGPPTVPDLRPMIPGQRPDGPRARERRAARPADLWRDFDDQPFPRHTDMRREVMEHSVSPVLSDRAVTIVVLTAATLCLLIVLLEALS
ncbi:MAG TPA: helix-turn-helix transcriptional regulator [Trebonia sp.]